MNEQHLTEQDMDLFTALRMTAFGKAVISVANDPSFDEWTFSAKIRYALEQENAARNERRTQKLLKASGTPNLGACVEDIRYLPDRSLTRDVVGPLASCQWVVNTTNVVIQLRAEGFSGRAIASAQGISRNSVADVLNAADAASRRWDELKDLTEEKVYQLLFPGRSEHESLFTQPDWSTVHKELAKVGTTLKLLHGEYADQAKTTGGAFMGYDRFCKTYQRYVLEHGATSRVEH